MMMKSDDWMTICYSIGTISGGCIAIIIGVAIINVVVHLFGSPLRISVEVPVDRPNKNPASHLKKKQKTP
jgi:hypothetical protein